MAKRRRSVKAGKKKASVKETEKNSKQDDTSSITGDDTSDAEIEESKHDEDSKMQEEPEREQENVEHRFKVELPVQFDSFEEFVSFMEPAVHKIEQTISRKKGTEDISEEDEESNSRKEVSDPSKIFHFYGALLKKILVADLSHDTLLLTLYKLEDESKSARGGARDHSSLRDYVREEFLAMIKKRKVKTLEKCKLKFNIGQNELLDTEVKLDEDELHPILLELIQRYDAALEGFSDQSYRKTYFDPPASKEDEGKDKKKKKTKKTTKSAEPRQMRTKDKIKKLMENLFEEFGKPQGEDMEAESERSSRKKGAQKKNSDIGGSFEIVAAREEDEMDEEMIESIAQEQELRGRLLEEFNDPNRFIKKLEDGSIRFKSKLFEDEKVHNSSIYTVLLACIVFGRRVARVSEDLTDPTTIDNLMEFSKFLPFPLANTIKKLQTKIVVSKALDIMLEHELENCMPHSSYQKSLKRFKEETHEMNKASLKVCPHLCKLYHHESCLISTDTYNRFEIYKKQLDILVSTYKYFAEDTNNPKSTPNSKSGKVSLSKIEVLYADAKQVSGIDEYTEFEFLENEFQHARKAEKGQFLSVDMIDEESSSKRKGPSSNRSRSPNPKESSPGTRSRRMDIEKSKEVYENDTGKNSVSKGKASAAKDSKNSTKKETLTKGKASTKKEQIERNSDHEKPKEYNEIELNRKLNQLRSKMTREQAEQKIEELQEDSDDHEEEILTLEKQIKNTKDWLYRYKEAIIIENKNLNNVDDLIEELDEIDVRVEEMELLLEKFISYHSWKKKFEAAVECMKRSWKTPNKDMEIETKLHIGQKGKKFEMISFKELQEIIAESNDLDLDRNEELQLKELKNKVTQARNLQDKISQNLPKVFDVKTLTSYENEINNLRIRLPQIETIQLRKQLNEEVIDLLNEVTTVEQIREFLEKSSDKSDEIDSDNYRKLRRKLTEGNKLQIAAEDIIDRYLNLDFDAINQVRAIVNQIEDLKIGFDEVERLSDILKTYAWLLKLHSLIQDDTIKAQSFEKLFTVDLEGMLPAFDVEQIIIQCKEFIEDKANNEEKFASLRETIESGEGIRMTDTRVQLLCEDYFSKLWYSEGEDFFNKIKTSRELERFLEHGPKHILDKMDEETVQRLNDELQRIKDWKKLYNETIEANLEGYIRWKLEKDLKDPAKRTKVMDLKWKLSKLDSEYTIDLAKYSDLEKSSLKVQKYLNWINWCFKVEATLNNIENGIKIASFKDLKELHTDAMDSEIPKNLDLYKKVENWYNIAVEILKDYKSKLESGKSTTGQRNPPKSIDKDSVRKVADKFKNRPSYAEAIRMKNELENKTSFISFSEEIYKIKDALDDYDKWQLKLQEFINNEGRSLLEPAKEKDNILENHDQIQKKIGYLKIDFALLELRNEEDEFKLTSLEWQYRAYLLMKKLNEEAGIEEWKKLIMYSNENPDVDSTFGKVFTKFLKEEMANFKKYHKIVKSLKKKEKSKDLESTEDVERLLAQIQKGLIKRADDEKFLEDLIAKCNKLVDRANQLVKSTQKEQIIEFTKALDQMKLFPVSLKAEESMLETTIDIANKLASFIRRHSNMEVENVEKALVEYSKCPIKIAEVEKLQENVEESKKTYQKLQEEVSKLNLVTSPTFEEIQDVSQRLDAIKWDHDGQLNQIKMQLYLQKVSILQNLSNIETDAQNPITVQALKSFVIDGQNLKKHIKEDRRLDQAVFWMENLLRKAEDKVRELGLIKSIEKLDQISKTILGVVDYSQEIIERKAYLTSGTAAPLPQHQIRLQQEDEEYIAGVKKSPMKAENKDEKDRKRSVTKSGEERKKRSDAGTTRDNTRKKKQENTSKPANPIGTLQETLERNGNIYLTTKEAKVYAEKIADAFPLVKHSKERLERFIELLNNVLKYRNIASSLVSKKFDVKEIGQLIKRKESDLVSIDKRLEDPTKKKILKPPTKEVETTKKTRTDESTKNMIESHARMSSQQSKLSSKSGITNDSLRSGDTVEPKIVDLTQKSKNTTSQFKESLRRSVRDDESKNSRNNESMELERNESSSRVERNNIDDELNYRDTMQSNLSLAEQKALTDKKKRVSGHYEPDNDSRQTRETNFTTRTRELQSSAGSKPTFKIFKGVLKTNEERIFPRVAFYSCNLLETIREVPQIIDERYDSVRIQEKISEQKFDSYINQLLDFYDSSQDYIVTGWIEADSEEYQACCERIAKNLIKTKTVGLTKYLDCAKIFFVHREQIPSEWARRLGFWVQKIHKGNSLASLAYILIYQQIKSSVDPSRLKKITAEAVSSVQESSSVTEDRFTRETSQSIESGRGRQLKKQISGPQTPDVLSVYEGKSLSRNPSISNVDNEPSLRSESSLPKNFKPPVFNIRPEFMNMDTDGHNSSYQGNSNTFQSNQNNRRNKQFANEQGGRMSENMIQEPYQDPYNEDLYEEEMNYKEEMGQEYSQVNKPKNFIKSGFPRDYSNDNRNSRESGRQQYNKWQNQRYSENSRQSLMQDSLESGELGHQQPSSFRREDNPRHTPVSKNRTPSKSPHDTGINPFYLEYLKSKSNANTLNSSPIAQKFLGYSPNRSFENQRATSNVKRSNYPYQNANKGKVYQKPTFYSSNKYQNYQNFSNQRPQQFKSENEKKGGFVYSNQMNTFSRNLNSNRYLKPYNQNYPPKNNWLDK